MKTTTTIKKNGKGQVQEEMRMVVNTLTGTPLRSALWTFRRGSYVTRIMHRYYGLKFFVLF